MSTFIAIIGASGSGKTTVVENLVKEYFPNEEIVISKTKRKRRFVTETGHEFCTAADLEKDRRSGCIVAYNYYDGNEYWATIEQIEKSKFFVVDIPGLMQLKREYKGPKKILTIGLGITAETAAKRMKARGDSPEKIADRLALDGDAFRDVADMSDLFIKVDNLSVEQVTDIVANYIKITEE